MVLCVILYAVSFVVLCARLWARFRILRQVGADDWMIILTKVLSTGLMVTTILGEQMRDVAVYFNVYLVSLTANQSYGAV